MYGTWTNKRYRPVLERSLRNVDRGHRLPDMDDDHGEPGQCESIRLNTPIRYRSSNVPIFFFSGLGIDEGTNSSIYGL
jgi:hypothetical protein